MNSELEKAKVNKPSLFVAAQALSEICDRLDSSEFEDQTLLEIFKTNSTELAESIDRRKYVYREADSKIELAKQFKKDLDATIKRLERVKEAIEETTKGVIEANPDIPFRDSLGSKVSVQNNSKSSLVLSFETGSKNVSNILDYHVAQGIPSKYVRRVSFTVLDTEALRFGLENNDEELKGKSFAVLKKGTHLRGLK